MRGQNKTNLMNEKYAKDGNFFLRIEVIDCNATHEIIGDGAVGMPAIAYVVACLLKQTNKPEIALKFFNNIIEKHMEDDDETK